MAMPRVIREIVKCPLKKAFVSINHCRFYCDYNAGYNEWEIWCDYKAGKRDSGDKKKEGKK